MREGRAFWLAPRAFGSHPRTPLPTALVLMYDDPLFPAHLEIDTATPLG
jgi:hypothetical protein